MINISKFINKLVKEPEWQSLEKGFRFFVSCEECACESKNLFVIDGFFVCDLCRDAMERRAKLIKADEDFENS